MVTNPGNHSSVSDDRLMRDLLRLGVGPGMVLTVHSSLSAIGWVDGGARTVVRCLLNVLGENGTLAMPSATPQCQDPAKWRETKFPDAKLSELRMNLPLFDLHNTPTEMGAIPETFRTWPGTLRSNHPLESVCAYGPQAAKITKHHPRAFSEGPDSPFDQLYQLDSWILLLGVGFNRCTALHFAESRVENCRITKVRFPWLEKGRRVWVEVENVADDNDTHFPIIGEIFVSKEKSLRGSVGDADSCLFSMRELVEIAGKYFETELV